MPTETRTDPEFYRVYYEHQYERMAKLEEQRLTFTNIVVTLTVVALTFSFPNTQGLTVINGLVLPALMFILNIFGAIYTYRTLQYIHIHRKRAKEVLKLCASEIYAIDEAISLPHLKPRLGLARIQLFLHIILTAPSLVLIALYILQSAAQPAL